MKIYERAFLADFLSYFMSCHVPMNGTGRGGGGEADFSKSFFRFVVNESIIACWHWPALWIRCSCFMIESYSQTLQLFEKTRTLPADFAIFTALADTFEWPLDDTHGKLRLLNCFRSICGSSWLDGHPRSKAAIMKQISWKFHRKYFVELWNW